jgi:hypothetical protein
MDKENHITHKVYCTTGIEFLDHETYTIYKVYRVYFNYFGYRVMEYGDLIFHNVDLYTDQKGHYISYSPGNDKNYFYLLIISVCKKTPYFKVFGQALI